MTATVTAIVKGVRGAPIRGSGARQRTFVLEQPPLVHVALLLDAHLGLHAVDLLDALLVLLGEQVDHVLLAVVQRDHLL